MHITQFFLHRLLLNSVLCVSQNVAEFYPYLASDYSGVCRIMYTARALVFTITQTGNAKHLLRSLTRGHHQTHPSAQR